MGVTVENKKTCERIKHLRRSGAQTKFLSMEPLLKRIPKIDLNDIDWMIVGGESGPSARLIKEEWVKDLRDKCISKNVAFFFKQWVNKKKLVDYLRERFGIKYFTELMTIKWLRSLK